ncbi:MAG: hypothetical protein IIC13_07330 [SAR324 cluster bacterium]|nr:hypothetical protein [SAR324 cluster bacterium]MCH8886385.1 hypothetical protein [SAR324 cluster bacterium]
MDSLINRLQPLGFYMVLLILFLVALAAGFIYFLSGISDTRYLVTDGIRLSVQYLDKPKFDSHLQGLIFSISFLAAGLLMVLFILLPNGRQTAAAGAAELGRPEPGEPPQPVHRAPPAPAQDSPAAPALDSLAENAEAQEPAAKASPLTIEAMEGDPPAAGETIQALGEEAGPKDLDDLPATEETEERYDENDDEDVVYGDGRITEDAAFDFVQTYPDSAVKFLYRKNLDNKPLPPSDEDIYRDWEARGLTRQKVREFVLEIMGWHSLPDAFPHQVWKELRDQIFEYQAKR